MVLDNSTPQEASAQLLTCGSLALPSIKPGNDAIPGAGGAAGEKGKALGAQRPISVPSSALPQLVGKGCPDLCVLSFKPAFFTLLFHFHQEAL